MNEVPLDEDPPQQQHQNPALLISSSDEIEELARDLASNYINYLTIDTNEQQQWYKESIQECLTNLEEVVSALESYRENHDQDIVQSIEKLMNKNDSLNKLYEQIDAVEQYMFEVTRVLDQLDVSMKELETHKRFSGNNKIQQIIDLIPRLSFGTMPRLGFLSGLMEEKSTNFVTTNDPNVRNDVSSINEILARVSNIENSLVESTSSLDSRLCKKREETRDIPSSSLNTLSIDMIQTDDEQPEQVDGSWQELL